MASDDVPVEQRKKQEKFVFAFIAIFLFPMLSIAFVGSYGLLIWVFQLIFGPPTS